MNPVLSRRLARTRLRPDRTFERAVVAIDSCSDSPRYVVRGWDDAPQGLDGAATRLRARVETRLAARDRAALEVEVGFVELVGAGRSQRSDYALVLAADVPLVLVTGAHAPRSLPASRDYARAESEAALPVVLRPSAVLSLVTAWLETSPPGDVRTALSDALRIEVTGASPYPPDHFPYADDAFALLARPEHWRFAFDGISDVRCRNLRLEPVAPARLPAQRYVAVDALRARAAPHGDATSWEAIWSVRDAGQVLAAGEPLLVALDPAALLAGARPAGAVQPACDRDPIQGDLWGWAPPLVLGSRADVLLERRA